MGQDVPYQAQDPAAGPGLALVVVIVGDGTISLSPTESLSRFCVSDFVVAEF